MTHPRHHRPLALPLPRPPGPVLRAPTPSPDAERPGPRVLVLFGEGLAEVAWAEWAQRFSPLVGVLPGEGLVLDVAGLAHLHGGEAALLARVACGFGAVGAEVRALLGGAPAALAALLRAGHPGGVLSEVEEAVLVPRLPVSALAIAPEVARALEGLGLRDVAALEAQPHGPLVRRFGMALARELLALRGARAPIRPVRPPPVHEVSREFLSPLVTAPGIERALGWLLERLCEGLLREEAGARLLVLRALRVDGTAQVLRQGLGRASRDAAHLHRLMAARVEELRPEEGFERLLLAAEVVEHLPASQHRLDGGAEAEQLAALLDRLAQRLELWRLQPQESHWPERAARRIPAHETPAGEWRAAPHRPLRLLRRPREVGAMALLPDAPPSLLRFGRARSERVVAAEGPERLLPEWWREGRLPPARDYYRVQLASGARLWVCRSGLPGDGARWFVHGHLA
jgi:protein ImuB